MTLAFTHVSFQYSSDVQVFTDLHIGCDAGEFVLIAGRNGCGKSTFLRLLNGILKPAGGTVTVNGLDTHAHNTARLARELSVTFQNPSDQLFASTVLKEAEFAPKNLGRTDSRSLANNALERFQLSEQAGVHPYDLSLARRKLLTLACAVASGTPILAFDEPSVHLSKPEKDVFSRVIGELRNEHKTILVVSHDLELFLPMATKVLLLSEGSVLFYDRPQLLLHDPSLLRRSGVRLPFPQRLRPHMGLPLSPAR